MARITLRRTQHVSKLRGERGDIEQLTSGLPLWRLSQAGMDFCLATRCFRFVISAYNRWA